MSESMSAEISTDSAPEPGSPSSIDGETPFSRAIEEHLSLKKRNAGLDGSMPIDRYEVVDPMENHPLFKSEEQARLEETLETMPENGSARAGRGRAGRDLVASLARPGRRRGAGAGRRPLGQVPRFRLGRVTSPGFSLY